MRSEGIQEERWGARPRWGHVAAVVVSVALSLAAHTALFELFPPLPIGRPAALDQQARIPSVQLREVLREFSGDRLQRPARFRPERPDAAEDLGRLQEAFARALEQAPPPAAEVFGPGLKGAASALQQPDPPKVREKWEPRVDILRIEEQLFAENISALPRRFIERTPRSSSAPEIAPPMDLAPLGMELSKEPPPRSSEVAAASGGATTVGTGEIGRGTAGAGPAAWDGFELAEQSRLMDEPAEEITGVQPVEHLLALAVETFRPEDEPGLLYFRIQISRQGAESLPVLPKDMVFLQDCSESMTTAKVREFGAALEQWLPSLNPGDRWMLVAFNDRIEKCREGWMGMDPGEVLQGRQCIRNLSVRGKTDMYASLQELLALRTDPARPAIALLLTDGRPTVGMVDSSEIIERFTRENAGLISVFALGAGARVNRFLLDLLSYKNRGDSLLVQDRQEIDGAMADLRRQVSRPVLAQLDCQFSSRVRLEVYPKTLTHLYLDRPLVLYGQTSVEAPLAALQIVGASGAQKRDMVFTLDWAGAPSGQEEIRTQWAWHKIYHLIGEHIRAGRPETLEEIRRLADVFRLPVPYGGDIPLP